MDATTFKTSEAEQIIGMPATSLRAMVRHGFSGPDSPGGRWSQQQVTAIAVMRACRRQGAPLVASVAAYDLLMRRTPQELAAAVEAGRRFLVLIGEMIILKPVDRDRAFSVDLQEQATRDQLPLVIVDLVQVNDFIDQSIQHLRGGEPRENFPGPPVNLARGRSVSL